MWNHVIAVRDSFASVSYKARLVLYALAARADRKGMCRPAIDTIVSDTSLSRNGVIRGLKELSDAGAVVQMGGEYAGRTNRYELFVGTSYAASRAASKDVRKARPADGKVVNNPCQVGTGRGEQVVNNPSQVGTPPVPTWHPPRAKLAPEEEIEDTKEVCSSRGHEASGRKAGPVDNFPAKDYGRLVRTAGWRPENMVDRRACMQLVYDLGATVEEAQKFDTRNAVAHWAQVNMTCTVLDLARRWVEVFRLQQPYAFEYEQERRRTGDRVLT